MKTICIVAHLGDLSGANVALVRLCTQLRDQNISIIVLVPRKGLLTARLEQEQIPYKVFGYTTWIDKRSSKKRLLKKFINLFADVRFFMFCVLHNIGVVHYNSIAVGVGVKALNILQIPYIWHIREFLNENIYSFHNKCKVIKYIDRASELVFVSKSIKKKYNEWFENRNQNIIYDGVDIKDVNCYVQDDYRNFIIVGGVERNKGQDQAIKALAQVANKEVHLYIVGPINDQVYYKELRNLIQIEGLEANIHFTGYTSNVDSYRKKCGIALVCSEYESFGLAAAEAINAGEVVIGSDSGGTTEILSDGKYGQLYTFGNINQLKSAIENVLQGKGTTPQKIEAAHIYLKKNFSIQNNVSNIISLYYKWL